MGWVRDAVLALEEQCLAAQPLPARAPVLSRPTLRVHIGSIAETSLGLYGTSRRRSLEIETVASFQTLYGSHISASRPVTAGQEGSAQSQWDFLFHSQGASAQQRQSLVDAGHIRIPLPSVGEELFVPVRDGPGRLPSSLTKIVVSNLAPDFMTQGVICSLLESAG